MSEEKKEKKPSNGKAKLDVILAVLLLICLVICYFFWGCSLDLIVTIIAVVIAVLGTAVLMMQAKKIKKLNEELENK